MPKAPMHKNRRMTRREHQIRRTRQIASMQSVAVAESMYQSSDDQFRLGVFAAHQ